MKEVYGYCVHFRYRGSGTIGKLLVRDVYQISSSVSEELIVKVDSLTEEEYNALLGTSYAREHIASVAKTKAYLWMERRFGPDVTLSLLRSFEREMGYNVEPSEIFVDGKVGL